jgi:hypothetical protein
MFLVLKRVIVCVTAHSNVHLVVCLMRLISVALRLVCLDQSRMK